MPGSAHEVLLAALREQPTLLGALVAKLTGVSLPGGLEPVDSAVRFVKTAEIRPDLLFRRRRKNWVLLELQRRCDPTKRRRWPLVASVLLDQTRVLGDVIVITARPDVARWALRVAHLRSRLGTKLSLTPVVLYLGAGAAEALLDEQRPELALFAAWAMHHRHGPKAKAVVERAIEITSRLPVPLRQAQMHAIVSVLSQRMLALLEELSMDPNKIPESPAARKLRLFFEARGAAKVKQDAILAFLVARGLPVSAEERAILRGCVDTVKLDRWIVRAATAASTGEVVAPETSPAPRGPRRRRAAAPKKAARRA